MAGANVPVDSVQRASTQIRNAKADTTMTAAAPRRLDGLDGVGGGGGGGGGAAGAAGGKNATVAAGTANKDVGATGAGGQTTDTQTANGSVTAGNATGGGGADPTAVNA
jgi:hypothetical protein